MYRRWVWVLVAAVLMAWIFNTASFAQEKEGQKEGAELQKPTEKSVNCMQNKPPIIEGVIFLLDEVVLDEPVQIEPKDIKTFQVGLKYRDAECNLGGGEVFGKFDDGKWELVSLVDEAYCSSEESGHFVFVPLPEKLATGEHKFEVALIDDCGHESQPFSFSFTLQEKKAEEPAAAAGGEQPAEQPAPEEKGPSEK